VRREPSERFANALELAEALRWSREQSPPIEPGERGAWALEPRKPRAPNPPPPPVAPEPATSVAPESTPTGAVEAQSTVLRVAPPSQPLDEALDVAADVAAKAPDPDEPPPGDPMTAAPES
jgi:hypothetical protein